MNWLTRADFAKLWPKTRPGLVDGIITTQATALALGEINSNLRLVHFLAQISHESAGGTVLEENLNYTAKRLHEVWPQRFPTELVASVYAHNPKALALKVYGGRMGNAPPPSMDGYDFRGRGYSQITGRDNYTALGKVTGLDLVNDPSQANSRQGAFIVACGMWKRAGANQAADADDIDLVTFHINGGHNGLAERKAWLAKWKAELGA